MISKELFERCAGEIGLTLPEDAFLLFDTYAARLVQYNEKVNLTAITAPDEIVIKHFADSLCLLKYVQVPENAAVCDVGTGAGFPGMCLRLARPDLRVTLFDSVNKKLDFLRALAAELGVDVNIVHCRAEDAGRDPAFREQYDVATARAVAALNKLGEYCVPLVKKGGFFAPMKAPLQPEELRQGAAAAKTLGAKLKEQYEYSLPTGDARTVLLFEKISQTPTKYPRVSAQIAKTPLGSA